MTFKSFGTQTQLTLHARKFISNGFFITTAINDPWSWNLPTTRWIGLRLW